MTDTAQIFQFPSAPEAPREKRGPQVEDGYTRMANDLLDALCQADFTSREFKVVHFVIRQTYGWNDKAKRMASTFIAGGTGLHESDCSKVLNELIRRKVVIRHGGSRSPISLNKHFGEWLASEQGKKTPPVKRPESGQDALAQSGQDALAKKDRKDTPTSNEVEATANAETVPKKRSVSSALPSCPHGDLLDLWAEIMPDKRQPIRSMWSKGARSKNLAARWKQGFSIKHEQTGEPLYTDTESGIAWWGKFFAFLRKSDFLMRDDSRFFGLDWIAKAENFEKIMELKYHGGDA